MRRRCCRPARSCIPSCGTTTPLGIRSIPIRMRRSRTDSARSTKWPRPGSAGTTCPTRTSQEKPTSGGRAGRHRRARAEKSRMKKYVVAIASAALLGGLVCTSDAQTNFARGQDVSPTFDGWEQNADGSYTLYFGYFNRNAEEEFDVPVGPANNFDPGGDRDQPTHFYASRKWW